MKLFGSKEAPANTTAEVPDWAPTGGLTVGELKKALSTFDDRQPVMLYRGTQNDWVPAGRVTDLQIHLKSDRAKHATAMVIVRVDDPKPWVHV